MAIAPGSQPLMLLVHRPGRMIAIVAAAVLALGAAVLVLLQVSTEFGRGWWSLAMMVPMVVGLLAIMRTGTTRCEVTAGEKELVVRSVDSSQVLGRSREVSYTWREIRRVSWVGDNNDELRLDFSGQPRALVFSGASRDLQALASRVSASGLGS